MPEQEDIMKHLLVTKTGLYLLKTLGRGNRSQGLRMIVSAILEQHRNGDTEAFDYATDLARRSPLAIRREIERCAGKKIWIRSTGWIPLEQFSYIEAHLRNSDLQGSDWLRGAVLGATQEDPNTMVSREGREAWDTDRINRA